MGSEWPFHFVFLSANSLTSGNCCNKRLVTNQWAPKTAAVTRQSVMETVVVTSCVATAAGMTAVAADRVDMRAGMAAAETAAAMTFLRTAGD